MSFALKKLAQLCCSVVAASLAAAPASAAGKDFTFSAKANERLAKKMAIPLYFALPQSSRAPLAKSFNTSDVLVDFKHPDAGNSDLGLRLIVTPRSGMASRLAKSGLVQTGDLLLTFRTEWGGAGAYPNIQMGISHTGLAYIKDGEVRTIENPLNEEYLGAGMRGNLTSEHYRTLSYLHIVRPRGLTDAQRANIAAWAQRFASNAKKIYPTQISFNQDYNAPKYKPGKTNDFIKRFGQVALAQSVPSGALDLFCSEFAWTLLSLKNCDPAKSGDAFKAKSMPSCISEPMTPMKVTGDYVFGHGRSASAGLADGPLLVIDSTKMPETERDKILHTVFVENPTALSKMSAGHKQVAVDMQPKFAPLEKYYLAAGGGALQNLKARIIQKAFIGSIPPNYSPTSFLVNTLLSPDNKNRTMDYVATVVIE